MLSALSLYVELLIIRWMSADIRAFTVFRTFPLISCFVGLGIGFALGNDKSYRLFPLCTLVFCLMMKACEVVGISTLSFPSLSTFQWANLAGLVTANAAYVVVFLLLMILLLALPFAMCVNIGARLSVLFIELPPLKAYSCNILGAIAGSAIFQLLSIAGTAPWQEVLLPMIVVAGWLQVQKKKLAIFNWLAIAIVPLVFLACQTQPAKPLMPALLNYQLGHSQTYWSPYQRIDLAVFATKPGKNEKSDFIGLEVSANKAFYQYFFNTKANSFLTNTELLDSVRKDYALPFTFNKAKSVLVVGSGTGQNVSFALQAGADQIDAVEIDPIILQIGQQYNPDYASPKVNMICDDARHFFNKCDKRYDVINFSTLDSHTVAGFGSSVRIDAYVYTKESIAKALSLLNDDGVVVISFATVAPWSKSRLAKTFADAAGYEPMLLQGKFSNSIFILGPKIKAHAYPVPAGYKTDTAPFPPGDRELTDDWPYLYVQPDVVDYPYLLVVAELLALAIYAARRQLFRKNEPLSWQMFFLGAAFMLLELHAISFLSLLYGSTWMTSALVINGVLIMIFFANLIIIKLGQKITSRQPLIYAALLAAILLSYSVSLDGVLNIFHHNHLIAYPAVTVITILPMGVAAAVFASAFSTSSNASQTLAFNLFGAVVGGLLEYLSNYIGIHNLLLVAASIYFASFLCHLRTGKFALTDAAPSAADHASDH